MSQMVEGPRKTFIAGSAAAANLRWKITDTTTNPPTIGLAAATDACIGVNEDAVLAASVPVALLLSTAQGTRKMVSSEAITGGDPVYAAAGGKVAATGTIVEGKALETTTANNDILEVLPVHNADISNAITGTTAATFQVDSDLGKPRAGLKSQTGGTGDYVAYYQAPATLTGARTYTGPADADDTLVGIAAAQTLTNKTLTEPKFGHTVTPVAAAGSTIADAAALANTFITHITSDGAAKGVKLPAVTTAGVVRIVVNNSSTAAELYAESTGTVNGAAADASMVIPASKGVLCISTAAKTWIAFDLPALASAS